MDLNDFLPVNTLIKESQALIDVRYKTAFFNKLERTKYLINREYNLNFSHQFVKQKSIWDHNFCIWTLWLQPFGSFWGVKRKFKSLCTEDWLMISVAKTVGNLLPKVRTSDSLKNYSREDSTEFILSVSSYSWFSETINLFLSLIISKTIKRPYSRQKT